MTASSSTVDNESITADESLRGAAIEDGVEKTYSSRNTAWHMENELQLMQNRDEEAGEKPRKLGVSWHNLTVKGIGSDATFNENVLSQSYPFHGSSKDAPMRTIIDNSHGCVKPGEMLLVLGRPGSGCTTLLSALANNRLGYEEVTGDVNFGSMSSQDAKQYRGQTRLAPKTEIQVDDHNFSLVEGLTASEEVMGHQTLPDAVVSIKATSGAKLVFFLEEKPLNDTFFDLASPLLSPCPRLSIFIRGRQHGSPHIRTRTTQESVKDRPRRS
ncbi:hypothetical protein EDB80DRAFT_689919 [Ilyonectria destructans]|nr:hypothetical protein EDB80DRAFT_689919 [Ilyonectria destructans]